MSATANRYHRNIKRIQRYCTQCGNRMRRLRLAKADRYDPATGEKKPKKYDYFWSCVFNSWGAPARHSGHDSWRTHGPN